MEESDVKKVNDKSFRDACLNWIHDWGNGGGCYSLQTWIEEKLGELDKSIQPDKLREEMLENDPDFGAKCYEEYKDVIECMFAGCCLEFGINDSRPKSKETKLILKYPDVRMIYKKPGSAKEFKEIFNRLFEAIKNDDMVGVQIAANQLQPIDVTEG